MPEPPRRRSIFDPPEPPDPQRQIPITWGDLKRAAGDLPDDVPILLTLHGHPLSIYKTYLTAWGVHLGYPEGSQIPAGIVVDVSIDPPGSAH